MRLTGCRHKRRRHLGAGTAVEGCLSRSSLAENTCAIRLLPLPAPMLKRGESRGVSSLHFAHTDSEGADP
jgi:hypothetical protein